MAHSQYTYKNVSESFGVIFHGLGMSSYSIRFPVYEILPQRKSETFLYAQNRQQRKRRLQSSPPTVSRRYSVSPHIPSHSFCPDPLMPEAIYPILCHPGYSVAFWRSRWWHYKRASLYLYHAENLASLRQVFQFWTEYIRRLWL